MYDNRKQQQTILDEKGREKKENYYIEPSEKDGKEEMWRVQNGWKGQEGIK